MIVKAFKITLEELDKVCELIKIYTAIAMLRTHQTHPGSLTEIIAVIEDSQNLETPFLVTGVAIEMANATQGTVMVSDKLFHIYDGLSIVDFKVEELKGQDQIMEKIIDYQKTLKSLLSKVYDVNSDTDEMQPSPKELLN